MLNRFELKIAFRYLLAQKRNLSSSFVVGFSFLGVVIGIWLLVFVLSVSNGFEREVKDQIVGKDAHFEINQYFYRPWKKNTNFLNKIAQIPEVIHVAPYVNKQAILSANSEFRGVQFLGIDSSKGREILGIVSQIRDGDYVFSGTDSKEKKRKGIILGYALAEYLGLSVGDLCYLYFLNEESSLSNLTPKISVFLVTALFESGIYEHDLASAYLSISDAQKAFNLKNRWIGLQGKVKDLENTKPVLDQIDLVLPPGFEVSDWKEKNSNLIRWIDYEKILIGLALGIIIIIAAFNVLGSVFMCVNNKKREIGILRAMGATRKNILFIFLVQGSILAFLGTIFGLIIGLLSCWLQFKFGFIRLPGDVYFVTQLPILVLWKDIVWIIFITHLLCLTASFFPALYASKQKPVSHLRYE